MYRSASYLITRVSNSVKNYWRKLSPVLVWINNTIDDKTSIGTSSLIHIYMCIDEAYAVHPHIRISTGGAMCKFSKQKLNSISLAEAELVVMSEYLPLFIWLMVFLEEQVYAIEDNMIY